MATQVLQDAPVKGVATDTANFLPESEEERGDVYGRMTRDMDNWRHLLTALWLLLDGYLTPSLNNNKKQNKFFF